MQSEHFDYIIIGGGSAGCVLAARLSEDPNVHVALLEAGPVDKNPFIHCPLGLAALAQTGQASWNFNTTAQVGLNGRKGFQPRGKVLGGSSSVNAMIYIRGQQQDFDYWAACGNKGWSFADVLPYFKRAQHNARGGDAFHGEGGPLHVTDLLEPNPLSHAFVAAAQQAGLQHNPDFNGASQEGVGIFQVTQKGGERWSAAKGYLTPNLDRPNLHVFTGVTVTKILLEKKRATGVDMQQRGQLQRMYANREVLLCAGAFQSPQILMLSGIGAKQHLLEHRIPVQHDLPGVGENLQDHCDTAIITVTPPNKQSLAFSPRGITKGLLGVLEWRKHRTGMLTTNVAEAGGFVKSDASEPTPDLQLHFLPTKLQNHGRDIPWTHGYSCRVCVLRPQSYGSVKLASNNPLDAPLIDPNFLAVRDDMERTLRGIKIIRSILKQPALASLGGKESAKSANAQSDVEIEHFIRENADTIYHPVGSCRMGSGTMDVVDSELRVHGIAGLRVVDASIMPRITSGNTNAVVIMIAEKAADMIKAAVH